MVGPEFASSWLKIGRAEHHFNALKEKLLKWRDSEPYSISKRYDPKTGRHSLVTEIVGAPPVDDFALIAGDCAHNVRSALDHLTYALAIRDTGINPPKDAGNLQFPIYETEEDFRAKRWRIASLSQKTQDFLESMQSYRKPYSLLPSIIVVLAIFNNFDKHRLIHLTYTQNVSGKITFLGPPNWVASEVTWLHEPLESGKVFAHFTTSPSNPDIQYTYEVSFSICAGHPPGPSGVVSSPLESLLSGMITEAKKILNRAITV